MRRVIPQPSKGKWMQIFQNEYFLMYADDPLLTQTRVHVDKETLHSACVCIYMTQITLYTPSLNVVMHRPFS
jgi:hypothetical protein